MKGKIAFVLGAAVGYVLGTRAGRERYEQIKRGAQTVWNTPPVQRGVDAVREAVGDQVDRVKASVVRAGRSAFSSFAGGDDAQRGGAEASPNDVVRRAAKREEEPGDAV